jgi:hemoglobin
MQPVPGSVIDEALIETLVRRFYDRVRADPLIGPVFEQRIVDWEPHLQRMMQFWSSVVLMSGRYQGSPMQKHARLPVDAQHFDRWLQLFGETARAVCPPAVAAVFEQRAATIARSLEMGVAASHGELVGREGRYRRSA